MEFVGDAHLNVGSNRINFSEYIFTFTTISLNAYATVSVVLTNTSFHKKHSPSLFVKANTMCAEHRPSFLRKLIQSTLVSSNSKGLSEILRDIRSSTYQIFRIEEKIIRLITFKKLICK